MANMKKLIESIDRISTEGTMSKAAKHKEGAKFGGYWKGTDPNPPKPGMGAGSCEEDKAFLGEPYIREDDDDDEEECPACDGTGRNYVNAFVDDEECRICGGTGHLKDGGFDDNVDEGILDDKVEEKYGLHVGDSVMITSGAYRGKKGHVIDLNFDGNDLEVLFSEPDAGKTAVVDARDTQALDEGYGTRMMADASWIEEDSWSDGTDQWSNSDNLWNDGTDQWSGGGGTMGIVAEEDNTSGRYIVFNETLDEKILSTNDVEEACREAVDWAERDAIAVSVLDTEENEGEEQIFFVDGYAEAERILHGDDEESDIDEAATPRRASLIKRIEEVSPGDQVSRDKQGNFIFRMGYYYRHGMDSNLFAKRVKETLEKHGFKVNIIDHGDHYAAFRGGATLKASSHFWVKAQVTETEPTEAPQVTAPIEEGDISDAERNRALAGANVNNRADPEKMAIWWSHYRRAVGNGQADRQAKNYADRMTASEPKFRPNLSIAKDSIDLDESVDDITEELKAAFEDYVSNEKYSDDTLYPSKNKKPASDKKKEKKPKVTDANLLGEGASSQEVANAISYRIERRKPELITKYGVEVVADEINRVASFHEGADELGSSDISAMVNQVVQDLERNYSSENINEETNKEEMGRRKKLLKAAEKKGDQDAIEHQRLEIRKLKGEMYRRARDKDMYVDHGLGESTESWNSNELGPRELSKLAQKSEDEKWKRHRQNRRSRKDEPVEKKPNRSVTATDLDETSQEESMTPYAIQLFQLLTPETRKDAFKYLDKLRNNYGSAKSLQAYRMAQRMRQENKNKVRSVEEDSPQVDPTTGQPIPQNTTPGQQPAVNTATPLTTPQTPAQQAPAPKGTPTAVAAPGQQQVPTAGQAGGAPVASPPGTPKPPTGSAANNTTTPIQNLATSLQQLAQPGSQLAAKKASDALARLK